MRNRLHIPIQSLAFQDAVMAGRYERRNLHPVVIAAAESVGWSTLRLNDVDSEERFGKAYRIAVKQYRKAQAERLDDIRCIVTS